MRVALVNTYDRDGGAARAVMRLHHALRGAGVESALFVDQRSGHDVAVHGEQGGTARLASRLRWEVDHFPAGLLGARRGEFSVNWIGSGLRARLASFAPDVIHLHWLNAGFVSLAEISRLRAPLLWTAHDMWPFTGGCHYDAGCGRFEGDGCARCPMQTRAPAVPLASRLLAARTRLAAARRIHYVAPSGWMATVAARSPVAQGCAVSLLPNAIDVDRYKPIDKRAARDLFGLPQDRLVLLFGGVLSSTDPRKGFALLDAALQRIAATPLAARLTVCVFGSAQRGAAQLHGIHTVHTGHLHDDESLIALYAAADVFVAPSLQDNLPNTVMEAAACGLPTVAFDIGGLGDLVRHRQTGWLAPPRDADGLAEGLLHALGDDVWRVAAGGAARAHAKASFAYPVVAAGHLRAYESALQGGQS